MKAIYCIIFLILLNPILIYSQNTFSIAGEITDEKGQTLPFVNVVFENNNEVFGISSDSAGQFELTLKGAVYQMKISAIGYLSRLEKIYISKDTVLGNIVMKEDLLGMQEIVVSANMKETYIADSPVKISVFTSTYINQILPATNLMESLKLMNGVQEINSCGVCMTNSISINGLPGAYTAILIDGTPAFGNLASVYGLNGIPMNIIERIELSKGPNSTLFGSEAMAGTLNIITKEASKQPKFSLDIMGTSDLEVFTNLSFSGKLLNQNFLAGFQHAYSDFFEDFNKDGLGDNVSLDRVSAFAKISGKTGLKSRYQNFIKYYYEDRRNGVKEYLDNRNYIELRGNDSIYGESIKTHRFEMMGTIELPIKENIRTDYSLSLHQQDSYYGADYYQAKQYIGFVNNIWNKKIKNHDLMAGATLRFQYYDDNTFVTENDNINLPDKQFIPGIWAQDEWNLVKNTLTVMPGMRLDYYNVHGLIPSPRLNIKYKPSTWWNVRFNVGTGFRIVNLFAEDHAFVSGQRQVVLEEELAPEQSYSASLNLNHVFTLFKGQGSFDFDLFYTHFTNAIIPDYSEPNSLIYRNLDGYMRSAGLAFNLNYSFNIPLSLNYGLNLLLAEEISHNRRKRLLFAPSWTNLLALNYLWGKAGMSFSYSFNISGPMALPEIYDLDMNGNPNYFSRPTVSKVFSLHNIQITKNFKNSKYAIYTGILNLFNYRQPLSPLSGFNDNNFPTGFSPFFDTSYSYSTIHGREFFLGLRLNI